MAGEKSIARALGDLKEAVLVADTSVRAFAEVLGDAEWPYWLYLLHRQVLAVSEGLDALELAVNRHGNREVCHGA